MGVIGWGVVGQGVGTRGSRGADPSSDERVPGGETHRKGRSACGGQIEKERPENQDPGGEMGSQGGRVGGRKTTWAPGGVEQAVARGRS